MTLTGPGGIGKTRLALQAAAALRDDNFEQIVAGAATLADLLSQSPRVKLIVTSRELLRIAGEHVFPVPPLALPDARRVAAPADVSDNAAVIGERSQPAFGNPD
jgi:predicted ATPase